MKRSFLVVASVLVLSAVAEAKRCRGGRFVVDGRPLVPHARDVEDDVVTMDAGQVAVASGCPPTVARVYAAGRWTRVRARWASCGGVEGPVRLKGRITPSCRGMTGSFRAKGAGVARRFRADLSECGDRFVDVVAGEECDSRNTTVCRPDCRFERHCPSASHGPGALAYTIGGTGTDLDLGFSGASHNFPAIGGLTLRYCLSSCDASTNPVCKAMGSIGVGSLNGPTFGPPLPLFAAGVPVCVRNDFNLNAMEGALQGTANVATGEFESTVDGAVTPIVLNSVVFSTSANQVCPECEGGRCDSGPRAGQSCRVEGSVRVRNLSQGIDELYTLSSSCPPGGIQGSMTGTIPIALPLTTGTAPTVAGSAPCPGQQKDDQCAIFGTTCSANCAATPDVKGGINQWCCGDALGTPCFPTASNSGEPDHAIVRTGTPVPPLSAGGNPWPDPGYPKTAEGVQQAATFCVSSSGSNTIDKLVGLPGPGALILTGTWVVASDFPQD